MTEPIPLREIEIDLDELFLVFAETPERWGIDVDWKEARAVVRGLRAALRKQGCSVPIPACRDIAQVEAWLAVVNGLIADPSAFPDGHAYELLDLAAGSDSFTILLCHKGSL